jgi:hypothetical protein
MKRIDYRTFNRLALGCVCCLCVIVIGCLANPPGDPSAPATETVKATFLSRDGQEPDCKADVMNVFPLADGKSQRTQIAFRFIIPEATVERTLRSEPRHLAPSDCGEMLIDLSTSLFVYRTWYDGIHEIAYSGRPRVGERDAYRHSDYRTVLKTAAGFDGKEFWLAHFPEQLNNEGHALTVEVSPSLEAISADCVRRRFHRSLSRCWFDSAPIHQLLAVIKCERLERAALEHSLDSAPGVVQGTSGEYTINSYALDSKTAEAIGAVWSYSIHMDDSRSGISRIDVTLPGASTGHWPFPVPDSYHIIRDEDRNLTTDEIAELSSWQHYADDRTKIVRDH